MKERGVFYGRVSDKRQSFGVSLEHQDATAEDWFRRQGIELVKLFRETGESARTRKRTTLRTVLQFIREQWLAGTPIDVFLVYDLSRFCRNLEDQLALKRELAGCGCRLESITFKVEETPVAALLTRGSVKTAVALVAANTTTTGQASISGKIVVGSAGTLIPSFATSVAAASVVSNDSYFIIWAAGSNTVQSVGSWS